MQLGKVVQVLQVETPAVMEPVPQEPVPQEVAAMLRPARRPDQEPTTQPVRAGG
jgi:hypothetical protein